MRETGSVIKIEGAIAKVSLVPSEVCKRCPACNFCRPAGGVRIIEVENRYDAHVGDEVYVEISPKIGLMAMFLLFGIPVILGLIGLVIGNLYSEIYSVVFGVVGFAGGLAFAKIINDFVSKHKFVPYIVEIITPEKT
jgi:positive regulator of sigma E activity